MEWIVNNNGKVVYDTLLKCFCYINKKKFVRMMNLKQQSKFVLRQQIHLCVNLTNIYELKGQLDSVKVTICLLN